MWWFKLKKVLNNKKKKEKVNRKVIQLINI